MEEFEIKTFTLKSNGIYAVLINDAEPRQLQPVIACQVQMFEFSKNLKFGQETALAELKAIASYFDMHKALWEPLVEKIRMQYKKSSAIDTQITLYKDLNLNITTELV